MKRLYRITVPVTIDLAYVVEADSADDALAVDVDLDEMFIVSPADTLGPCAARVDNHDEITDSAADWGAARVELIGDADTEYDVGDDEDGTDWWG